MGMLNKDIIKLNEDILPAVYASSNYGVHGCGKKNYRKQLSFLVAADVHGDTERMKDAVCYMNRIDSLDFGIHLGDMQPGNFVENDGSWYVNTILAAEKPFYTVIGNHDGGNSKIRSISATSEQVFEKFIRPLKEQMSIPNLDKTYYSVNFDTYKVSLVVLDDYNQPEDRDENGDFLFSRGSAVISEEQLNWFIQTLREIPEDYHLLIARHAFPEESIVTECPWSQPGQVMATINPGYGHQDMITAVIDAWMNGQMLKKQIKPAADYPNLPILNIDIDYSTRGKGNFVGYFTGHMHCDVIGISKTFPKQNVFSFASACSDEWQNAGSDLPRTEGTRQQDCLTVCSVDTENRLVKFIRVGSNITVNLTERKYLVVKY